MKKLGYALSICALLFPGFAEASGAAPPLYGVKEVLIRSVHFANPDASDDCGLSNTSIVNALKSDFQGTGLSILTEADNKPPVGNTPRVEMVPEIVSINDGLDCRSWVSISAQTDNNIAIAPIDILRNVTVVYWHEGSLINSAQAVHQQFVIDALQKMVVSFGKEYRADQKL